MFLGHVYQVPAACTTVAGICLEKGDWAAWSASVATFLAVVVAMLVAFRDMWKRNRERKRTAEIFLRIMVSDISRARRSVRLINQRIDAVLKQKVGEWVDDGAANDLIQIEERFNFPALESHAEQLIHMPRDKGDVLASLIGLSPYIKAQMKMVADSRLSRSLSDDDMEAARRVKETTDHLLASMKILT